jgi:hypothetical protein
LEFGIHYGRQIEFEYEVTVDPTVDSRVPSQPHVESLATPKFRLPLLSSLNTIANRDSARGLVTIPMTDYLAWLEEVKLHANRCLLP